MSKEKTESILFQPGIYLISIENKKPKEYEITKKLIITGISNNKKEE